MDKKKLQDNFYITIYLLHFFGQLHFVLERTSTCTSAVGTKSTYTAYGMNGNLNCGIVAELGVTVKDTESFPCKTSRIRHLSESVLSKKTLDS